MAGRVVQVARDARPLLGDGDAQLAPGVVLAPLRPLAALTDAVTDDPSAAPEQAAEQAGTTGGSSCPIAVPVMWAAKSTATTPPVSRGPKRGSG